MTGDFLEWPGDICHHEGGKHPCARQSGARISHCPISCAILLELVMPDLCMNLVIFSKIIGTYVKFVLLNFLKMFNHNGGCGYFQHTHPYIAIQLTVVLNHNNYYYY